MMDLHVVFLNHYLVCNVTPLLTPDNSVKQVLALGRPAQRDRADDLKCVLNSRGIVVRFVALTTERPTELCEQIEHAIRETLAQLPGQPHLQPQLNATAADVPCLLAASEIFRQHGWPIFYVDPWQDTLHWAAGRPGTPPLDLPNRLRIPDFLRVYGSEIEGPLQRQVLPDDVQTLCRDWIRLAQSSPSSLRRMNVLAYEAGQPERQRPLSRQDLGDSTLQHMIDGLLGLGYARIHEGRLTFRTEEARSFANGIWFENWVFTELHALREQIPDIQDLALGVSIMREVGEESVRNEFDVMVLAANRLFLIECKTKVLGNDNKGTEALYKLDALTELMGGFPARAAICSFLPITDGDRLRAHDMGIEVFDGQFNQLPERLRTWIERGIKPGAKSRR